MRNTRARQVLRADKRLMINVMLWIMAVNVCNADRARGNLATVACFAQPVVYGPRQHVSVSAVAAAQMFVQLNTLASVHTIHLCHNLLASGSEGNSARSLLIRL